MTPKMRTALGVGLVALLLAFMSVGGASYAADMDAGVASTLITWVGALGLLTFVACVVVIAVELIRSRN